MAMLPLRGWVIPLGTILDNGVTFGVHLYPKCQELVKKWATYGQFLRERLCDFMKDYSGLCSIIKVSFEPKLMRIG